MKSVSNKSDINIYPHNIMNTLS